MLTARDLATVQEGDSVAVAAAKVDSILQGCDIVRFALGDGWLEAWPMGEIMAANDRNRIGTPSSFVSHITEAVRFARTHPDMFQEFVQGNRQAHDLAELEAVFAPV